MKEIWHITALQMRLAWKKKTLLGLILATIALNSLIFFVSSGQNPSETLQVKILYSQSISYFFVMLCMVLTACFTSQNQIAEKNLHQMTSIALPRYKIFLGQACSSLIQSCIALAALYSSSFINKEIYYRSLSEQDAQSLRAERSLNIHRERPQTPEAYELTMNFAKNNKITMQEGMPRDVWTQFYNYARSAQEALPQKKVKSYLFQNNGQSTLWLKIDAPYRRQYPIRIELSSGAEQMAFSSQEITIPSFTWHQVPLNEEASIHPQLEVLITNLSDKSLTLNPYKNIYLESQPQAAWINIFKAFLLQWLQIFSLSIIGQICGTGLSFAVGIFTSISLFFFACTSPFIQSIAEDMLFHFSVPTGELIMARLAQAVSFTLDSFAPPPILNDLASNIAIQDKFFWAQTMKQCLGTVVILVIGSLILKNKEVCKLEV